MASPFFSFIPLIPSTELCTGRCDSGPPPRYLAVCLAGLVPMGRKNGCQVVMLASAGTAVPYPHSCALARARCALLDCGALEDQDEMGIDGISVEQDSGVIHTV